MNKNKKIFILIIVLLILGTIGTVLLRSGNSQQPVSETKFDGFAQCLATKNLTMYGAVWCSHCKAQKALFGNSFKYVPYVECTEKPDQCLAKDIQGYPTWVDEKGVKYIGEQSLEKLSQVTGCELPK